MTTEEVTQLVKGGNIGEGMDIQGMHTYHIPIEDTMTGIS